MKLRIYYEAIDPCYSSHEKLFIGINEESCYMQKEEYEEWLGRNHPNGIKNLYNTYKVTSKYDKI